MANELQAGYLTGETLYVSVLSGALRWHTGDEAFEAYNAAHWTSYDVALTEQGTSGSYFGDFPTAIPSGTYSLELRRQMGDSPAVTDPILASETLAWDGDSEEEEEEEEETGAYSSPSGAYIRLVSGLKGEAYGITNGALEALLAAQVDEAEAQTFARVGTAYRTNPDLTNAEVALLQLAVAYRAARFLFWRAYTERLTGTHEPLLVAEPEDLKEAIAAFDAMAAEQEGLVLGVTSTATPQLETGTLTLPEYSPYETWLTDQRAWLGA